MQTLNENITELLARVGLGVSEFARMAEIDTTIFYRIGRSLRPKTAWKIANAYAKHTGITPEDAYAKLITKSKDATD